ncbi:MAG: peptide deformylase [Coxiella sp. (in: Bacteria)]|nr:MAG: peptide deformylase [Coxiella sp. (in: g-proteobacteria)]
MAVIRILQFPDVRLKASARKVDNFEDPKFQQIVDDMFETHYASANCAALAATQLDLIDPPHVTVIDFSPAKDQPLCLVNGEVIEGSGEHTEEEGCMSVGCDLGVGVWEKVTRPEKIKVRAHDRHGKLLEFEADGFMAKCIQHELDHLNGKIFLDHLSKLKRLRLEKKLDKLKRLKKLNEQDS